MNRYQYSGPVMNFETCIKKNWEASTYAVSEQKARSNFAFRFKQEYGLRANAKIVLPGKIIIEC